MSVPFIGEFGPAPITWLLDAWIIVFMALCLVRGRTTTWILIAILSLYLVTRVVPIVFTLPPLDEFLRAYRWVLYLLAFALAVGRKWGTTKPLVVATMLLVGLATLKAVLTLVILGPGQRPGLLLESNFELGLFAGLLAVVYRHMRYGLLVLMMLGLATVLSGSRSGAVAVFIVAVYAIIQIEPKTLLTRYAKWLSIPALAAVPIVVFLVRAQSETHGIDRLRFLNVFLGETSDWTWITWLFGTMPLTPVSSAGCSNLSFYYGLFSSAGDGECYSVIFHMFVVRAIFDAGILGLLISIAVPAFVLWKSRVPFWLGSCLLLIAIANGLSVSGMNNPYVALPILVAVLVAGNTAAVRSRPDNPSPPGEGERRGPEPAPEREPLSL